MQKRNANHQVLKCRKNLLNQVLKTLGMQGNNYSKLTDMGFPNENEYVKENDVIIGKIHPIHSKKDSKELYRCCSTTIKNAESG